MLYGSEKDWFCSGCVCCMEVRKTGFVEVGYVLYGSEKKWFCRSWVCVVVI